MGQRPSLPADVAKIEELRQQLRAMEVQREPTTSSVEKERREFISCFRDFISILSSNSSTTL